MVNGPANASGSAIYVLNYAAKDAATLQRARAQMQETQNTFRALNAAERAAAKPWIIRAVAYPRGGFAELARTSPLPSAEAQLRLVNGFYGGGEPKPGQLVKVIE